MPRSAGFRVEFWLAALLACITSAAFAQTNSVATINSNFVFVLNGKKIFPITMSPGPPNLSVTPTGKDALQELREAGATMFRIAQSADWDSTLISNQTVALEWALTNGMFCMVNLRELSAFSAGDAATEAELRSVVNQFKNHPALGVWKNKDEAWWGGTSVASLSNGYFVIKQEDANHPIEQTHAPRGTVADLQPYNVAADIVAVDEYPIGYPPGANTVDTNISATTEISQFGDWTKFVSQVANGQKHYWMVEQIAWSGATPPNKTMRFPDFTQERFMAYEAIIHGARGLMFFGGNVAATHNATDAPLGWNWTFWTNVLRRVVQELGDKGALTNALVAPTSSLPVTVTGTNTTGVEFCVREDYPYVYILACKREGPTVYVTFNGLPTTSTVTGDVVYESPRVVTANSGGQFSDWFAPFDVHVYRFYITNQNATITSQPQSRTNFSTTTATFAVAATGTAPLTYQWRKNGSTLSDGGNISGATSTGLTLSNLALSDAGSYDVIVSGVGSVTSVVAILTVVVDPNPTINSSPQSRTNIAGTTAAFTVSASNPGSLTYQWRRNGAALSDGGSVSGATTSALTLFSVASSDAASYDVIVTAINSVTTAPPAVLTVINQGASLFLYEPFDYFNIGGPVSSNAPANWNYGGSGVNDLSLVSGNLSYPGLATSIGNSVTNGGAGLGVRRLFGTNVSSGAIYFSGLFRINDLGYGAWNGVATIIGALTPTDNATFRLQVMIQSNSPAGYVIGVKKGGTGATTTLDTTEYYTNNTIFVVGKYDFTVSSNRASLWINPSSSTFASPSEPAGAITSTNGTDGFTIDRFNMRQNTTVSVPAAMQWDELRFGFSWADVTPTNAGITFFSAVTLTNVQKLANGSFRFAYSNDTSTGTIYASTNAVNWSPIGAATQISPGLYQFTDTTATNHPRRLYQLRSP